MPELPEVETVRRGLEGQVLGRTIKQVTVTYAKMIRMDKERFIQEVTGQTILAVNRRGKYLLFDLGEVLLISHLRMEGKYFHYPRQAPEDKHAHVDFGLDDGSHLVYQDVRKFGTMELVAKKDLEAFIASHRLGPEPVAESFTLDSFQAGLKRSKKPIKNHLLDQSLVAGLGNIYVDEVLWASSLHPERPSQSLSQDEVIRLRENIIRIMALAIEKGGSTIRTYHNAFGENGRMQDELKVYGQTGQACPRCGHPIEKIKVGGRGSHLCPVCQEKNRT
ncbi:DNA-formamidopyrimidine glycosylase [Streptococcus sp. DD12]|uniref:DNA-formamidopyrimidine glycosylase n=1 Tax=Streptococcus sp. DD12 TaxID=1777880 RepID=UPI0007933CD8|nr:DNA-formamidopyrimidine glycosylase [Streptococcus sp. DD12]KXT76015.1 Formamidopyrimidine-DNA glycosylase [Streptococcus sp. DD12]